MADRPIDGVLDLIVNDLLELSSTRRSPWAPSPVYAVLDLVLEELVHAAVIGVLFGRETIADIG